MCCNGDSPGLLDKPADGWPYDTFPPHIASVPCIMCHGSGRISSDEWDKMCRPKAEPVKKEKKQESSEKLGLSIWEGMKALKEQQEQDWFEQGPFDMASYKKVD